MLGTRLGDRYTIISALGVGGFGQTYLAHDTHQLDDAYCVVKHFSPASRDTQALEVARRLFDKEVETLKRLGQHDQIPTFLDFFEDNREFYLVQEFIDGKPLNRELSEHRLTEPEVIGLLTDVLNVLSFVHSQNVIHRDIKPGNLIRRQQDGKIVLIDFGAVKELHTQIASTSETNLTVGIGTYGYTPSEQLAGKPRFCSDIYALGITAIQALTGIQPSQLPEDPHTSDYLWRDYASVSPGLAFILDRMIKFHYSQRYQSAQDVLQALEQLPHLHNEDTALLPSILLPPSLLAQETQPGYLLAKPTQSRWMGIKIVAIATLAVTTAVLGLRQLEWLEPLELTAYDRMVQIRPPLPADDRLLVVEITEADLKTLQRPTPSDRDVATVMATLLRYNPRVVGLDLYRDLPQEPGQAELLQQLNDPRAIAIMNLGDLETTQIPPPPTVPLERVGFNDFPVDPDGVIRRSLMFGDTDSTSYYAFSLRLALKYLEAETIQAKPSPKNADLLQLADVVFHPLTPTSGGYQQADTAGYQVMLDYRNADSPTRRISFTEVLNQEIDPSWVTDRVVLIGTTAPSSKDLFNTPYTTGRKDDARMAGVTIHAQMVSQYLSAVLDQRPLFWFLPEWVEIGWIAVWAAAGGTTAWLLHHPLKLALGGLKLLLILSGTTLFAFTQHGWLPTMAPAIASALTGGTVIIIRGYQNQKQQNDLAILLGMDSVTHSSTK